MRLECSNKEFQGKCKHRIQKSKTEGLKNAFLYFLNFIEHVLLNQHFSILKYLAEQNCCITGNQGKWLYSWTYGPRSFRDCILYDALSVISSIRSLCAFFLRTAFVTNKCIPLQHSSLGCWHLLCNVHCESSDRATSQVTGSEGLCEVKGFCKAHAKLPLAQQDKLMEKESYLTNQGRSTSPGGWQEQRTRSLERWICLLPLSSLFPLLYVPEVYWAAMLLRGRGVFVLSQD